MNERKSLPLWRLSSLVYCVSAISILYLLFEYFFIPFSALTADEFVFARHIYEYTFHIPYIDFSPYKTTLGYYLLSIPFFFSPVTLKSIFYAKIEVAAINAVFFILSSVWATRYFDKRAIILTLLAVLANQSFLMYSVDLRVDMLTCWFCLFSALAILQQRFSLAGILFGAAFLISQKALWYFMAINGGMLICWLTLANSSYRLRALLTFNITTLAAIFTYVVFWSLISNPKLVLSNLFYEAYIQAGITYYSTIYLACWQSVLKHGSLLFLLFPLTYLCLFSNERVTQQRLFIVCFSSIAFILFTAYKQAFPYNFVFTIPAFFLIYAEFLSFVFALKSNEKLTKSPSFYLMLSYSVVIIAFVYFAELPLINYLLGLAPISLYCLLHAKNFRVNFYLFLNLFALTGIVCPFYLSLIGSLYLDGTYQRTMISLTENLLSDGGDYVGGIPFLITKDQPIDGMKNLIGPALEYLETPSASLEPLMLPSLYLTTTTQEKILQDFEAMPIKVIISNYRTVHLPAKISEYIKNNYQHFYGSIYLYSPLISPEQLTFHLKFSGQYKIESTSKRRISIDGKYVRKGQTVTLKAGDHVSDALKPYRLVLIPNNIKLDTTFEKDDWVSMIKGIVA